jgi:peptide/nickel transport system substrate-binding protein
VLQRFAPSAMLARNIVVALVLTAIAVSAGARTRPHYGGSLRVEVEGDPLQRPNGVAWRLMLDGLTRLDSDGAVRPSLAVRWTSEDGGHRWQFWLRPGVSLHNSRPLNALAVVTSLEESCRPTTCPWTAVRTLGQSVVFIGDNPMPDLPATLAEGEFLIKGSSGQVAETVGSAPAILGSGPFRMKDSKDGVIRLEANDDCWRGRPFLDAIEIDGHRPAREQWMDLSLGKADLAEVRPSDIRQARQQRMNVVVSPSVELLALEVHNSELAPQLRTAMAQAVDRAALFQVIFQKQGEVTASLLPASLSGYSFLFPAERDLNRAQALRGGIAPPALTLAVDGTGAIQLAAERLALNLHDAGFTVRVIAPASNTSIPANADLVLRTLPVAGGTPAEALNAMLRRFGLDTPVFAQDAVASYKVERDFLDRHAVIPLLYLPHAWAVSGRLRDLQLTAEGLPDLANVSLSSSNEEAP